MHPHDARRRQRILPQLDRLAVGSRADYHSSVDDLTDEQTEELQTRLLTLRDELTALFESTREGTRPVSLDEPIGRLTRMDAMQQQSMSAANRRQTDVRLRQVEQALGLAERGEYGLCRRCQGPIGYARLSARPESVFCVACQDEIDRKRG
jgi:DnaK suppressor protein